MKKNIGFSQIRTHTDSSGSESLTTYPLSHRDLLVGARISKVYKQLPQSLPMDTAFIDQKEL